ncbi:CHAT domain-containing protein [candidate division KSB1 bacterium]|nr:CHAT domain-containing protein [candidate division KSB1 bacterium]
MNEGNPARIHKDQQHEPNNGDGEKSQYPRTERFINRDSEIEKVKQALNRIIKVEPPFYEGYVYWGLPGIGKSRMLRRIETVCRDTALSPAWVDFETQNLGSCQNYLFHVADQLDRRRNGRGFRDSLRAVANDFSDSEKGLAEVLKAFAHGAKQRLRRAPLILLMDNCESCSAEIFDWIGRQFLVQFRNFRLSPVALFLASRGPRVTESRWPPEIIGATHLHHLPPFEFKATKQHIVAIDDPPRCKGGEKDIHALSTGHPFSTEAVVYFLKTLDIKVQDFPQHREKLARRLYDEVIQRCLCAGVKEWDMAIFDVACMPRRFNPDLLEKIAPERLSQQYAVGLRELQRADIHLVEVEHGMLGFRLESTLRRLLHTAVSILEPARALEWNEKLKTFHENELVAGTRIGRPNATALLELLYHHAQIEILSNRPPQDAIKNLLVTKLGAHFHPHQHDDSVELEHFRALLRDDTDLHEILGKPTLHQLDRAVKRFLESPKSPHAVTHLIIRHKPPAAYQIGCYSGNPTLVDVQTIHTHAKFAIQQWRDDSITIGGAAFRTYLTDQAQLFIKRRRQPAVLLTTDTMDIPFELLYDGKQFVCLSRPFSRRIELKATPKKFDTPPSKTPRALVVGNPTGDLKHAEQEAGAVADLLETAEFQVDRRIGRDPDNLNHVVRLLANNSYHLIHFACHGFFNKREPSLSGLLFDRHNRMMISADELERILQGPAFIFFSACWAAAAHPKTTKVNFQGKFIQNLAVAALKGGACGCLGPMWEIGDHIGKDFALAFYQLLLQGSNCGEAVLKARQKVRRRQLDCWASWVHFGDPFFDPLASTRVGIKH